MSSTGRELMTRFVQAMDTLDVMALEGLFHPDYVGEYPQSRERFRGFTAFRAQLERFPGGPPAGDAVPEPPVIFGDDERWAITPGYTVVPLTGPDRYTTVVRARYADGTLWHNITIIEVRDELIWRTTTYFAPEFERPAWRKGLTELY